MQKKKKVAIIGSAGLPSNYGGFETLVRYLTDYKKNEFDFTVFCQKTAKDNRLKEYNGTKLLYLPFRANGSQSIIYDVFSIIISWYRFDTLLILGTPGCIILPFLNIFKKTHTIINFGGLEWARDKWGSLGKKYLKLSERIAVKNSTIVVADNQHFCDYIKERYGIHSELIEYGGDHVQQAKSNEELFEKYSFLRFPYDLSISRAQIDNNLHLLLEAYSKLPDRNLVLISNYKSFEYGRHLKEKYKGFPNLYLQDAVYDLDELNVIRSKANLYIHSHSSCGTAPSLVEAMNYGLPVISYDVPTNRFTVEESTPFFKNEVELIKILSQITEDAKIELGIKMKEISNRRYTWKSISDKYSNIF